MSAAMFTLRKVLGSKSRCLAQRSIATSVQRYRIQREPTYLDTCGVRSKRFANQQTTFLQFNSYFSSTSTITDKQIVDEGKDNSQNNTSESLDKSDSVSVEINIDTLIENVSKEITQKPSDEPRENVNSRTPNNVRAGDWVCGSCQFHNFSYRVSCKQCRTSREGESEKSIEVSSSTYERRPGRMSESRAGDWNCNSCGFKNFSYRKICLKCNNDKDKRNDVNASNDHDTDSNTFETDQEQMSQWYCYDCNTINFRFRTQCFKCNASKSVMTQLANKDSKSNPREGDWICPDCQFMNFARRTECMKCRLPKNTE